MFSGSDLTLLAAPLLRARQHTEKMMYGMRLFHTALLRTLAQMGARIDHVA
jgi:hypothetical protein